ncbi:hypothetical protein SNEBB_002268 [Seison nebaliae]|nr:hypothetical protein SNEBB_002268 [Seison nebaliae]
MDKSELFDFLEAGFGVSANDYYEQTYTDSKDSYNGNFFSKVQNTLQDLKDKTERKFDEIDNKHHNKKWLNDHKVDEPLPYFRGTIYRSSDFNAELAAHTLYQYLFGDHENSGALIGKLLTRMSNRQRQQMLAAFSHSYDIDAVEEIKHKYHGHVENVLKSLLRSLRDYEAKELHFAIKYLFKNKGTLQEIICTRTTEEIDEIAISYQRIYGKKLRSMVEEHSDGHLETILVNLITKGREPEKYGVNPRAVEHDAKLMSENMNNEQFINGEFMNIMSFRSFSHLNATFRRYRQITGQNIINSLLKSTNGEYKKILLSIAKCAVNKPRYFAELLAKAMKGLGTDERQQHRILITRSEIDLVDISDAFEKLTGKSLKKKLQDENRGTYEQILLDIIDEDKQPM